MKAAIRFSVLPYLLFNTLASAATTELPVLELNNPTSAPFTTAQRDGFLDIIVGEAFKRAGLQLELVTLPAERALINANEGLEDGDLSRISGLEKTYPNLVRVPESIFTMDFVAFTRKPTPVTANWDTLEPFSVTHITGWKIFEQNLTPKTYVTQVTSPEQLFEMLQRDHVQIALYSRWMGLALAKQRGLSDIRVIEPPLARREMFIYLHKRHEKLTAPIAAQLHNLKGDGTYTRVCREIFERIAPPNQQCDTP